MDAAKPDNASTLYIPVTEPISPPFPPISLSHIQTHSCLFSYKTALTTQCSASPLSTREPVAVRAPFTSGTGMTRSSSPT